jgi:hypothetical protein
MTPLIPRQNGGRRVNVTIEPSRTPIVLLQGGQCMIGEETSQRLDVMPTQFRVIATLVSNMPPGLRAG